MFLKLESTKNDIGRIRIKPDHLASFYEIDKSNDDVLKLEGHEYNLVNISDKLSKYVKKILEEKEDKEGYELLKEYDEFMTGYLDTVEEIKNFPKKYLVLRTYDKLFYTVKDTIEDVEEQFKNLDFNDKMGSYIYD